MKAWDAEPGRALILSVDPGEDVLEAITTACADAGIADGYVASGVGTLDRCRLHYVTTTSYPPIEHFPEWHDTALEIVGMSGLIVEGAPHIHATVADAAQAWGGHLENGCRVLYLAEIVVIELRGAALHRSPDARGIVRLRTTDP